MRYRVSRGPRSPGGSLLEVLGVPEVLRSQGWVALFYHAKRRMFLKSLYYCKKRRIPMYLTKTVLKRTSKAIFNMKKVDLDES